MYIVINVQYTLFILCCYHECQIFIFRNRLVHVCTFSNKEVFHCDRWERETDFTAKLTSSLIAVILKTLWEEIAFALLQFFNILIHT